MTDRKTSYTFRIVATCLLLAAALLHGIQAKAQKNDTVYFLNGDRVSGEILHYKYGYLNYKTYGVGTVDVKYEKINTFFSKKSFDILLKDGSRRFGSFDTSNMVQFVKIVTLNDTMLTPIIEIVEITPISKKFWKRLDGNVDMGI